MDDIVFEEKQTERVDKYLKDTLHISRQKARELIEQQQVLVMGLSVHPSYRLRFGDKVRILSLHLPSPFQVEPNHGNLDILFEDDDIIVVNKPAGLIVHPAGHGNADTLVSRILAHTILFNTGDPFRPGVVHRLDKGTSGAIMFVKTESAYQSIIEQFKNREIDKHYLAVAEGIFVPREKNVEVAVIHSKSDFTKMQVCFLGGKKTSTRFKVLQYFDTETVLDVELRTGRTHQIRVVLAFLGFPVIGDEKYGKRSAFISRPALHAHKLSFRHPSSGSVVGFTVPIPDDFKRLLQVLEK